MGDRGNVRKWGVDEVGPWGMVMPGHRSLPFAAIKMFCITIRPQISRGKNYRLKPWANEPFFP